MASSGWDNNPLQVLLPAEVGTGFTVLLTDINGLKVDQMFKSLPKAKFLTLDVVEG